MQCACVIFLSDLVLQYFTSLSQKRSNFRKKKIFAEYVMCVLISLQSLSNTFLILRGYERDMVKMYTGLNVKYP